MSQRKKRTSESVRLKESGVTTLMLVVVVGTFLMVEFPSALFFTLYIIGNSLNVYIMAPGSLHAASMTINFLIMLSYPINFFIYCAMSNQFRSTFAGIFTCRAMSSKRNGSVSMSTRTELFHQAGASTNNGIRFVMADVVAERLATDKC